MAKVSPSLLSADFSVLGAECQSVLEAGAEMLHFDVMDGAFVPNLTFGLPVLKSLRRALPAAVFDVHLMIQHPAVYAPVFVKAGADYVTFHLESADDPGEVIEAIHHAGGKAGLALKPGTPALAACPYLERLDMVLVMSVEPGFGGQSFLPGTPEKLQIIAQECKVRGVRPLLSVDGGVAMETGTAALCVQAGADVLVAGSAVFGAPDRAAAVRALRAL